MPLFEEYASLRSFMKFFEEFSAIPHGSENTKPIADYLEGFARARGLDYVRDGYDNVIIKKAATVGYEDRPTVILQGHTDMVPEKLAGVDKDMSKDGLDLYRDGDFLRAKGTTLGGDDGVMIAYALALLDSTDIPHPAIECVFTADEEIGLIGATGLDTSCLSGRLMINIDSDDEGVLTVGCAGGVRADITLPMTRGNYAECGYKVSVTGLEGGHSGVDIDKGRLNAIKLLGALLNDIGGVRIIDLCGGNADNSIPREAECVFASEKDFDYILKAVKNAEIRYRETETEISINCEKAAGGVCLDNISSEALISLIDREPVGVISMDEALPDLVETSLNMGIAKLHQNEFELTFSIRSSVNEKKEALLCRVKDIANELGATVSCHGAYPGWSYRSDSHLREVMCKCFEEMYGYAPKVVTIHAGLECGIFADKIPGLDCVSIGPDNFGIHTPDEHLSIPSTERVWDYLKAVLKNV